MCSQGGRTHSCLRGVPQHRRLIARALGVVSQQRGVRIAAFFQRGQQSGVQFGLAVRRDPRFHGHPDKLVPESQPRAVGNEDPGRDALVGRCLRVRQDPGQQGRFHARPDDCRGLHRPPGAGARPGEPSAHRVAHRRGDRRPPGLQDLAHVERVAAGDPVQFGGVDVTLPDQLADGFHGQRGEPHPPGRALCGQVAQDQPERVIGGHFVVAVTGQQQRRYPAQPPPEEAEQVDRGLVGPVHVLEHRHGEPGGRANLGEEAGEQPLPRRPAAAQGGELPVELRADVEQRAERAGGEQAVATAPQPAGPRQLLLELLEEHGLAHPGFPGHQDQPAAAPLCLARVLGQRLQKRCPLEQFHDWAPLLPRHWIVAVPPGRRQAQPVRARPHPHPIRPDDGKCRGCHRVLRAGARRARAAPACPRTTATAGPLARGGPGRLLLGHGRRATPGHRYPGAAYLT